MEIIEAIICVALFWLGFWLGIKLRLRERIRNWWNRRR